MHIFSMPWRRRLLGAALATAVIGLALVLTLLLLGQEQPTLATDTPVPSGPINSRLEAVQRALLMAQAYQVKPEAAFVGQMTLRQWVEAQGGSLGEAVPNKDVWVVVFKPKDPITVTDRGHTVTYALLEVVLIKETGAIEIDALRPPGRAPTIPMNDQTHTPLP